MMTEETKPQEDRLEKLFAELGEMKKENAALRQDVLRLALTPTPHYEPEETDDGPDLKGLPDFNMDPDAHMRERDKRVAAYAAQRIMADQKPRVTAEQRNEKLWQDFQKAYPDLAKDPEKVEIAVKKAMDLGQTRGYDMEKYMYLHSDVFFEDVVKAHNHFFKGEEKPVVEEKKKEEEPTEEETNRAWGIFGGSEGANETRKTVDEEQLGSLTADLKKMQRDAGLSW